MDFPTDLFLAAREFLHPAPKSLYKHALYSLSEGYVCMADFGSFDALVFLGTDCPFPVAQSIRLPSGQTLARADLTHDTAQILRKRFPFTAPRRVLGEKCTFGLGDRLGIASAGHLRAVSKFDVFPVLAQQSMRELSLMGNTYESVIDQATFGVFREHYTKGFGADGDHLKSASEVKCALKSGCTMITLDCCQYLHQVQKPGDVHLPENLAKEYCTQPIAVGNYAVHFTEEQLLEAYEVYSDAIAFAADIYRTCLKDVHADFELSIDETQVPTTPAQHYFVANELRKAGVVVETIAPRFCGEFQKGIDYLGNRDQFLREFKVHAAIADHFGYKLSIHSGSDKFSVYPIIGKETGGKYHVKTSGTSWLEAMRLTAYADPALFRAIYQYAQTVYEEVRTYYHVSTELSQVPSIALLSDSELPQLLQDAHARQLLHITYGKIMNHRRSDGSYAFREKLWDLFRRNSEGYANLLETHITDHLSLLF